MANGGGAGRTDGQTDGRMEIPPCVLQDIGPLGPLPKNDWRFNTSLENSVEAYQKERRGLDLAKLEDVATFNKRLRSEEMNNYESDKMSPKGSKAIGDGNPDCRPKQDLKVSNDHQKNNPRSTCESSCPASESARERKNSPQITPTDKVSNDIVQPRRSARLAEKGKELIKLGF